MFKKLKYKFIIINMSLLTFVFFCIFGVIYFITWNSGERQINFSLNALIHEPNNGGPSKGGPLNNGILINLDHNLNVINIITPYNVDKDILVELAVNILSKESSSGVIKIENTDFAYFKSLDGKINRIALINKSPQQNLLKNLLKTFFITGFISLIILFTISYYLAYKTIAPIKEVFEKQKQFIADASHELRTPIAIIKTNLALVSSNKDKTIESQGKWMNYIDLQTDRMSHLIDDMLSLAKLDEDKKVLNLQPININKILENLLMSFEAVFFENKIELQNNLKDNFFINGDLEEIKKLFNILMDNAIKHTFPNGTITITSSKLKSKMEIIITNTGEGIPDKDLEKIFERFYRSDESRQRKTGGYGLGLAIANSIVISHKGKIYARSNAGKDTSFIVELPILE
ncbi:MULTISPECIES: HAMP domain-containing sensor histidine kinase [unclassified Clostridium]|uniref:sensor histidine kinase n=1 Tax=unclassified Clostridium TaxID=2614128 RepID=UPI00321633D9